MQLGLHCQLSLLHCLFIVCFCVPSSHKAAACVRVLLVGLDAQHSLQALLEGALLACRAGRHIKHHKSAVLVHHILLHMFQGCMRRCWAHLLLVVALQGLLWWRGWQGPTRA